MSVERVSSEDLIQLASDVGAVPWQVGAVLVMDASSGFDVSDASAAIAERIVGVPRLRQVLARTPLGCGRPVWVDDAHFDVRRHIDCVPCAAPGDEVALLETAVRLFADRLPTDRPLWRATFVTGVAGSQVALLVVFHHVLADGIGGLAVLANLVDGAPVPQAAAFPRPGPSRRELARDALHARLAALGRLPHSLHALRAAVKELDPRDAMRSSATTMNRPTGARRHLVAAHADVASLRAVAHAHGATVNDVVLTAITGALRGVLRQRGDPADSVVISVPVSARASASTGDLGNRVGVMAVNLPLYGDRDTRLERIAAITRAHKTSARGASAAILAPLFRLLAALHLMAWFTNHQHMVNAFETNLHGPDEVMSFVGHRVTAVLPVTSIVGNVTMSFAVLSYIGKLVLMVVADPDANPDVDLLGSLLQEQLDALAHA